MKRIQYLWNRLSRLFWYRLPVDHPQHLVSEKPLFIIFNPAWPDPPRQWYFSMEDALKDARTLSMKQPQDSFYVLKAVQVVSRGPITAMELPGGSE